MFMFKLNENGTVTATLAPLGGEPGDDLARVRPRAMAFDKTGLMFAGGDVLGKTKIAPELDAGQRAAFVLAFEDNGGMAWKQVYAGDSASGGPAATGLATANGKLYLTGFFSESLDIDPLGPAGLVQRAGYNPFLARLDIAGARADWLHAFDGTGQPGAASPFYAGMLGAEVVVAGSWIRQLDISKESAGGILPPKGDGVTDTDIVAAKFK
ncbi:hypothetical protein [Polyangium mundeleinium]|uniref:Uncharacterized protein n=1 Tax=Polyangium mundeleinium TaxID=2995306 RepID=A0ABT5EX56_9BACT|nr:hypothetical protein [Polyangium mundeleinium]MDC0745376.1 hypothetical protein [Polyangium mundeleinium]